MNESESRANNAGERSESGDDQGRAEALAIRESYGQELLEDMSETTIQFGKNFRTEVYNMSEDGASKEDVNEEAGGLAKF